jgi:hypothetical protein
MTSFMENVVRRIFAAVQTNDFQKAKRREGGGRPTAGAKARTIRSK